MPELLFGGRSVVHNVATAQRRVRELLPRGETHLWSQATHGLSAEFPDEVNILDFITRHTSQ